MIYFFLIGFIAIAAVYLWLTSTVKRTIVQPVKDGKALDMLLSEKTRWKVIKEDHGLSIGFFLGLGVCLIIYLTIW